MYKFIFIVFLFIGIFHNRYCIANNNVHNQTGNYIFCLGTNLVITDGNNFPIFTRKLPNNVVNFKMHNPGEFTYYDFNKECFYLLDSAFIIQDTIKLKNNYHTDYHDIKIDTNKNIYLLGNEYEIMDLSNVFAGGSSIATVSGCVMQILDFNKELIFQWKSLDHIDVKDANTAYINETSLAIDYFHANAIDFDSDSNIYISSRHLDQIIKINKTGDVVWRLGGKKNEFSLLSDSYFFSGQHSLNFINDSTISLFDNGNITHPDFSRGAIYRIDQVDKIIELQTEFRLNSNTFSSKKGNVCHYNGNIVIGWGDNNDNFLYSEFDQFGCLLKTVTTDSIYKTSYATYKINWMHNIFSTNLDTLEYEITSLGESKSENIVITNNSNDEIIISKTFCTNDVFTIDENLPITIPGKGFVNVSVRFTPNENSGAHPGDLYFVNRTTDPYPQQIATSIHLIGISPDQKAPEINITPDNESINISVDTTIYISFNEDIRHYNNNEIENQDIISGIKLRKNNIDGENVDYNPSFNKLLSQIAIEPVNLENDQVYYLYIDDVFEDYSDNLIKDTAIYFTTKSAVGVNTFDKQLPKVYPNPVYDILNIESTNNYITRIRIYDLTGRLLKIFKKPEVKSITLNIEDLEKGVYIVEIQNSIDDIVKYKIVKY